jgi:hypothetical protein
MSKISFHKGEFNSNAEVNDKLTFTLQQTITHGYSSTTFSSMSFNGLWACISNEISVTAKIYKRANLYNNFIFKQSFTEGGGSKFGRFSQFSKDGTYLIITKPELSVNGRIHIYKLNLDTDLYSEIYELAMIGGTSVNFFSSYTFMSSDGNYIICTQKPSGGDGDQYNVIVRTPNTDIYTNLGQILTETFLSSPAIIGISKNGEVLLRYAGGNNVEVLQKNSNANTWTVQSTINHTSTPNAGSLDDDGLTYAIGDPDFNSNEGQVFIYERAITNWTNTATINASDAGLSIVATENFGQFVKLSPSGKRLYVSSSATEETNTGRLWIYDKVDTSWVFRGRLENIVGDIDSVVAIDYTGNSIIVNNSTFAYLYKIENKSNIANSIKCRQLNLVRNEYELNIYPHKSTGKYDMILPPFNQSGCLYNNGKGDLSWKNTNQSLNKSDNVNFNKIQLSQSATIPTSNYLLVLSLRKLIPTYESDCIEVRRSSDNALLRIGFTNDNCLDIGILTNFLNTSDGYIKTWYDQSGNQNNFEQIINTNQPKIILSGVANSQVLLFDGTDDFLNGGDILDIGTNVGWFVNVVGMTNTNNGTFISKELNTTSTNRWSLRYGSTTFDSIFHDSAETSISTSRTANSSPEIISLNIDRDNTVKSLDVFINNSLFASTTITENDTYDHSSATRCLIGARSDATDVGELDYLDGQISEIIIRNVLTTNIERQGIEQNQAEHNGFSITNVSKTSISSSDTLTADYTINMPNAQGSSDNILKNDGSGNLSWERKNNLSIFNETTTSVTLNATHDIVLCSNGTGCTVNLPDANTFIGKKFRIINFNASGAIGINISGSDTINNGQTSVSLITQHERTFIESVGDGQWYTF